MTERGRRFNAPRRRLVSCRTKPIRREGSDIVIDLTKSQFRVRRHNCCPERIKGRIRFSPDAVTSHVFDIGQDGAHRWWPVSPTGRIALELETGARTGPAMATWTATGAANRSKTVSSSGTGRAD
jgi:carotenoid 1,2-hydratase